VVEIALLWEMLTFALVDLRSQVIGGPGRFTPRSGTTLVWHSLLGWLEDLPRRLRK
jgi:hypothetical protein